jgi:hypothetical protein
VMPALRRMSAALVMSRFLAPLAGPARQSR